MIQVQTLLRGLSYLVFSTILTTTFVFADPPTDVTPTPTPVVDPTPTPTPPAPPPIPTGTINTCISPTLNIVSALLTAQAKSIKGGGVRVRVAVIDSTQSAQSVTLALPNFGLAPGASPNAIPSNSVSVPAGIYADRGNINNSTVTIGSASDYVFPCEKKIKFKIAFKKGPSSKVVTTDELTFPGYLSINKKK